MLTHVKVLALLHVALGMFGLAVALFLLLVIGGVAGVVGGVAPDSWFAVSVLGLIGSVVFLFLLALSLPGLVAGVGLLSLKPWARILTLVLSALNLLHVPLGTALGIYGFWVLLHEDTEALFKRPLPLPSDSPGR